MKKIIDFLLCVSLLVLAAGVTLADHDRPAELIKKVQVELRDDGYRPGPADGRMGPRTRAALRSFQREAGLEVTGELDAPTLERLGIDHDNDSEGIFEKVGEAVADGAVVTAKATAKGARVAAKGTAKGAKVVAKSTKKGAVKSAEAVSKAAEETGEFFVGESPDEHLEEAVQAKLRKHPRIDEDRIKVRVEDQVVYLTFHGNDRTEWNRAIAQARSVRGVKHVFVRFHNSH